MLTSTVSPIVAAAAQPTHINKTVHMTNSFFITFSSFIGVFLSFIV
jgi:hypothetical protein